MGGNRTSIRGEAEAISDLREFDWTVCRALLSANSKAMHAMELQMLQSRSNREGNTDEAVRALEEAISEHEAIIDDLSLAAELLKQQS